MFCWNWYMTDSYTIFWLDKRLLRQYVHVYPMEVWIRNTYSIYLWTYIFFYILALHQLDELPDKLTIAPLGNVHLKSWNLSRPKEPVGGSPNMLHQSSKSAKYNCDYKSTRKKSFFGWYELHLIVFRSEIIRERWNIFIDLYCLFKWVALKSIL